MEKQHGELGAKVDELVTTLRVREAKASLTKVSTLKGGPFEDQIHTLMRGVAAGLGDEYTDTSKTLGLTKSRKGDSVLRVGTTAVVVEVTDSVAVAASARSGASELATAEERILDAALQLEKFDDIKKSAAGIRNSTAKIERECTAIATSIQRLLDEALTAPGGAAAPAAGKSEVA